MSVKWPLSVELRNCSSGWLWSEPESRSQPGQYLLRGGWEACLPIFSRLVVQFSLLKISTEPWLLLLLFTAGVPHLQLRLLSSVPSHGGLWGFACSQKTLCGLTCIIFFSFDICMIMVWIYWERSSGQGPLGFTAWWWCAGCDEHWLRGETLATVSLAFVEFWRDLFLVMIFSVGFFYQNRTQNVNIICHCRTHVVPWH